MLSIQKIQKLVDDPSLSDEELEQIRDEFHMLAEVIFESFKSKVKIKS